MIKRFFIFLALIYLALILLPLLTEVKPATELNSLAEKYVTDGPAELGSANLVTSIIVTYRGLDTLGEVAVLFIATAGIGFLLRKKAGSNEKKRRAASEILRSGTRFLLPLIFLFGIYIFVHGHLTPGGGFQGGVIIASGIVLLIVAFTETKINHLLLTTIESFSGVFYVILGILGIFLAGGFLDNSIMELGTFGKLFSAGAIPLIYSLVGMKVGSELVSIVDNLQKDEI